jgi:methyl-accepting chemotaxis protein
VTSRFNSLFARLFVAMLVVAVVPLIVLWMLEYRQRRIDDEAVAREALSQQARLIGQNFIDNVRQPILRELQFVVRSPAIERYLLVSDSLKVIAVADVERAMLEVGRETAALASIQFVDKIGMRQAQVEDGKRSRDQTSLIADPPSGTSEIDQRRHARQRKLFERLRTVPYFTAVAELPIVGDSEPSILAGMSRMNPVTGTFAGAVIVEFRLNQFLADLASLKFHGVEHIWVWTSDQVVLQPPSEPRIDPRNAATPELTVTGTGATRIVQAEVVPNQPLLSIGLAVPGEVFDKFTRQSTRRYALWLTLIVSLVIGAAALISKLLSRPLRELALVSGKVASGELGTKVDLKGGKEIEQVGESFNQMVERLKEIPTSLRESTALLNDSVASLSASAKEQNQMVTRQAAALQETQVTVQEIKQTSILAAQKAEAVLQVTERADEIGRQGEAAIEQSLGGMTDIRLQVEEIAHKIGELAERTRQIGIITETVKDLADQSNMLALNAAIEAVRSGEHGKGFAVVAREIRSLADQSIQATNRVREILDDVGTATRQAVTITEKGAVKMEGSLVQIKASGDSLRELSAIVRDNSAAVRQIAAAVSQQNAGITQIFSAVTDLNTMMDETVERIEATTKSLSTLDDVSQKVAVVVQSFRV